MRPLIKPFMVYFLERETRHVFELAVMDCMACGAEQLLVMKPLLSSRHFTTDSSHIMILCDCRIELLKWKRNISDQSRWDG